jgi:hypothetical protein
MDEFQRLLGGSAISLEYSWHEHEVAGVALAELLLLLSMLQVAAPPLMRVCVPGVGGGLACPWLVAVATLADGGDTKQHVDAHAHVWVV